MQLADKYESHSVCRAWEIKWGKKGKNKTGLKQVHDCGTNLFTSRQVQIIFFLIEHHFFSLNQLKFNKVELKFVR